MSDEAMGALFTIAVLFTAILFYHLGHRTAERKGNENLIQFAQVAGLMPGPIGPRLVDARPLNVKITDHAERNGYTVRLAEQVGIYLRANGSRAFAFSLVQPGFLTGVDWDDMLMKQLEYQVQKERKGQHFGDIVVPIQDNSRGEIIAEFGEIPFSDQPPERPRRVR